MTLKVLVVDDSGFFRRRLTDLINSAPDLTVVGTASNGLEAIEKTQLLHPDVITMDYEMPVMDGITAVRRIMASCPTPILMFSSLTYEGARITLDSLDAGAVDYLPKNFEEIAKSAAGLKKKLFDAIREVAASRGKKAPAGTASGDGPAASSVRERTVAPRAPVSPAATIKTTQAPVSASAGPKAGGRHRHYDLGIIGTSTGGPVALQKILTGLPADFSLPLILVQHMPASFTPAFAERLNAMCKIQVKEAVDGDMIASGTALLAPGGKQLMISKRGQVKVLPGDDRLNYKPCVDVTFGSAANIYQEKVLAIVLTGMGSDGKEGARLLKNVGATVWAQDEASCVIYGMPMAIAKAGLADEILSLTDVGNRLKEIR